METLSKTTVGVKNLLRWGSNRRSLENKVDVFTIPSIFSKTYKLWCIEGVLYWCKFLIFDICLATGASLQIEKFTRI